MLKDNREVLSACQISQSSLKAYELNAGRCCGRGAQFIDIAWHGCCNPQLSISWWTPGRDQQEGYLEPSTRGSRAPRRALSARCYRFPAHQGKLTFVVISIIYSCICPSTWAKLGNACGFCTVFRSKINFYNMQIYYNCTCLDKQSSNRAHVLQVLHNTFQKIAAELAAQQISPIQGLLYPFSSTTTPLRQFSQAQHIGKIVACIPSPAGVSSGAAESAGLWMVTGGLGSLGNITAQWLADQGCRHICLIGRTGRYESNIYDCRLDFYGNVPLYEKTYIIQFSTKYSCVSHRLNICNMIGKHNIYGVLIAMITSIHAGWFVVLQDC